MNLKSRGDSSPSGIAIFGAWGGSNAGDEVILLTMKEELARRQIAGKVYAIGLGPRREQIDPKLAEFYAAQNIDYDSWRNLRRTLLVSIRFPVVVGGGQILDGGWSGALLVIFAILFILNRAAGFCPLIVGVGVHKIDNVVPRLVIRFLVFVSGAVSCRDQHTFKKLRSICGATGKLHLTADVVFVRSQQMLKTTLPKDIVAFAVHGAPGKSQEDEAELAKIISRFLGQMTSLDEFHLCAHDCRPGFDLDVARRIQEQVRSSRVKLRTFTNAEECLTYYRDVRLVMAIRMHPLIIALTMGRPCIAFKGSEKVRDLAHFINIPFIDPHELLGLSDLDIRLLTREAKMHGRSIVASEINMLKATTLAAENFTLIERNLRITCSRQQAQELHRFK